MKIEWYTGTRASWQAVKYLAPNTIARIFGVVVGKLFIGLLWRTSELVPTTQPEERTEP